MATAYPLAWPVTVQRTKVLQRKRALFFSTKTKYIGSTSYKSQGDKTMAEAVSEVMDQVQRFGGKNLTISTNVRLRNDGYPRSGESQPSDPGAAVYFVLRDVPYCLPCDRWTRVEDNLWAIAKHLDAMRGMERWGVGSVEQQFLGYKALPQTAGAGEDCWMVLGLKWDIVSAHRLDVAISEVVAAHRRLAMQSHPDRGGSQEQMSRINTARDAALAALKAVR